ncbi:hypothetical protein CAEBREN_18129 [Caenorhabditis brenneri]|uniref:Uncharacterized protein n=1 Tax=Caenorhabditis brenneri TaxID=135651 RepID=G0P5A5_CAEBE|nr:hypothetical protein CAEBREN_18129 [Caenorhabditis brenneri]
MLLLIRGEWVRFDKLILTSNFRQAEDQEYQNRLELWGKGIVEQEDVEFLRPKAIAKNLDIYDEIAKFYHEQNWTADDSCVVTTSEESVKEINNLIVRYKSSSGQLDQLDSWMVKAQPKEFGLATLIETHKDSVKIPVAVGGHVRITESVGSGRNRQRRGAIGKIESVLKIGVDISSLVLLFPNCENNIDTHSGSLYPANFYCAALRVTRAEGLFITNLLYDNLKK